MRTINRPVFVALAIVAFVGLTACRNSGSTTTTPEGAVPPGGSAPAGATTTIRGYVNSGLKGSMTPLIAAYREVAPKVTVTAEYLSAKEITDRLAKGDKPDFVVDGFSNLSKNASHRLAGTKDVAYGIDFIQIAVKAGNPKGITDLKPFGADSATKSALCASEEPCGKVGVAVLTGQGITPAPDAFGDEPSGLVADLVSGQVDVALLFRSDVKAYGTDKLAGIDVPGAERGEHTFQLMLVKKTAESMAFATFVDNDKLAESTLTKVGLRPLAAAAAKPAAAPTTVRR